MAQSSAIGDCVHCGRLIRFGDYFWATTYGPFCSRECMDNADAVRTVDQFAAAAANHRKEGQPQ